MELYRLIDNGPRSSTVWPTRTTWNTFSSVKKMAGKVKKNTIHCDQNVHPCVEVGGRRPQGRTWQSARNDERWMGPNRLLDYGVLMARKYCVEFRAAGRPADYQMNIYATLKSGEAQVDWDPTVVLAIVFAGSDQSNCRNAKSIAMASGSRCRAGHH